MRPDMDRRFNTLLLLLMMVALSASLNAEKKRKPSSDDMMAKSSADVASPDKSASANLSPSYQIGSGDILKVNVWHETEVSQSLTVRPDGMISLPLVGDIQAAGLNPEQLGSNIQQKLSTYMQNPHVTVIVSEIRS